MENEPDAFDDPLNIVFKEDAERQRGDPSSQDTSPTRETAPVQGDARYFKAIVALHTTEVQAVWSRYSAMLTANAVVVAVLGAFLRRAPMALGDTVFLLTGSLFGLALSWAWWSITEAGWDLSSELFKSLQASALLVTDHPTDPVQRWKERRNVHAEDTDDIRRSAEFVIRLFIFGYCAMAAYFAFRLGYNPAAVG
jgi:hypothetical protein